MLKICLVEDEDKEAERLSAAIRRYMQEKDLQYRVTRFSDAPRRVHVRRLDGCGRLHPRPRL